MKYDFIVCRYGELSTKGKNRRNFTHRLIQNIKSQLKEFDTLSYEPHFDRLFIHLNGTDGLKVADELQNVFGLSSFSLAIKVERDLDEIAQASLELVKNKKEKTFKVIARRHDKSFIHISDTINRHIASLILKNTDLKVDVRNPEIPIYVEVRKDAVYIMLDKIPAGQGYPVGIQGRVLMMLSGGIDSPVAAYLLMKRGVEVEFIHFASPPYTSEESLNKVITLAKKLTTYQNTIKVHIVNFTDIQLEIYKNLPESYAITMMRRYFLRIANIYAKKHKILAIGNGENLGQVASQTLHSFEAIGAIESLPILRPLLTYDKIEIINLAKKLDTYETSILPFEDCCTIFTPKNPTTRPKAHRIDYYESQLELDELIELSLENIETRVYKYKEDLEESFL